MNIYRIDDDEVAVWMNLSIYSEEYKVGGEENWQKSILWVVPN